MSQENVEVVRQAYEWVTVHKDLNRDLLHPDFEWDATEVAPDTGGQMGFEAALEFLHGYWETFDDFRTAIESVIHADEERVVTYARDDGRMRGSDSEVRNYYFQVFTFREGKIVRLSIHTDKQRALEAVGLREADSSIGE